MRRKFMALVIGAFIAVQAIGGGAAVAEEKLRPFVLASQGAGDMASAVAATEAKLRGAGLEVVATWSPYENASVIVVTSDAMKSVAAKSKFGGYGAAQRVSVAAKDGLVQVAYTNPRYMAAAYRMAGDMADVAKALAGALGDKGAFGSEEGLSVKELGEYHYMFGMEYFDEPSVLANHGSYQATLAAVEKGLAAGTSGATKVYRIDIPGKEESVFGVALKGDGIDDGEMQDDRYIMGQIDFREIKSLAHLPYEILVSGDTAYALYARFRIAINFPDLSMMGDNSFMRIMGAPEAIEKALTAASGGKPKRTPNF